MTHLCRIACLLLLPTLVWSQESDLLFVQKGDLPIILTAPHGGRKPIPETPERKGVGVKKFVTGRDDNTAELTIKLAADIEKRLGAKPYVVLAHWERKYLDVNRPAQDAFESPKAGVHYEAFHKAVRAACAQVQADWGRGILIDMHGQAAQADAVFRGTQNGKTVSDLQKTFSSKVLVGPNGLFTNIQKHGWKVIPALDSADKEDPRYSGGYIVQTYGSHQGTRIDAIQFELGAQLRASKTLAKTAEQLADVIVTFAGEFVPAKKASGK